MIFNDLSLTSARRNLTLCACCVLTWLPAEAQQVIMPQLPETDNFYEAAEVMNAHYRDHPDARGYKQWKRKEWFLEPRLYPTGERRNLTLKTHTAYQEYMRSRNHEQHRSPHGYWNFIGPASNVGGLGRINSIAFHPTDANTIYIGAANGGIWKTTNGGTSWSNVSPHIPLLSIADLKLSPEDPNVLFALTGDGDPLIDESDAHSQTEVSSIGILVSTNGGGTWYPGNLGFEHPSPLVPTQLQIHPDDVDIQFIACQTGILRTTDLWETYDTAYGIGTYDIEFHPDNPDIMYASGNQWIARSTDNGVQWEVVADADFNAMNSATRVELAVGPDDPDVVYALSGNKSGFTAFLQSLSAGDDNTWTLKNTTTTAPGGFSLYCIGLTIDENDFTNVFGGMQWISRSLDEGSSWTAIVQNAVHADIHDVAYTHGALWVACDGGLYKSTDQGNTWTDLSQGLAITEIYRIAGTPQNTELYFMGTQDNGTLRRPWATPNFDHVLGGDGMTCHINYNNTSIVYTSQYDGYVVKSTNNGDQGSYNSIAVPGGASNWITPFILGSNDPGKVFVGKADVYRSDAGGGSGTWHSLGQPLGVFLNCLAQGTDDPNVLYASASSNIARTDSALWSGGAVTWNNVGGGLPNLFITGIAVDPGNSSRVFVTLSGYLNGQKVFMSQNGGNNWTNISGSLPNVPANCIVYDDNGADGLYIGTDVGVFYRDNNIGDWIYFSNNLPAANVSDLYINSANLTIAAGTYGRGLWRTGLYNSCPTDVVLNDTGTPIGGVRYYSASNSVHSDVNYRYDMGTEIHYEAGSYVNLTTGFALGGLSYLEIKLGGCPGVVSSPLSEAFVPGGKWIAAEAPLREMPGTD